MKSAPELVDDEEGKNPYWDETWTVEVKASAFKFPVLARLGIAVGMLVLLFVSMIALLPMALPPSMTISKAEQLISDIVGVDVTIKGKHSFSILPSLRLKAENIVQTSQGGRVSLSLPYLEVEMSALGALSGSVDLRRVILRNPSLRMNTMMQEPQMSENAPEIDRAWGWWRDMTVENLQVENADISLVDSLTGKIQKLENFSVQKVKPRKGEADDGLMLDGHGVLNGQNIKLHLSASSPQLLVSGNRWPYNITLESALLGGSFDGSFAMRERVVSDGDLKLSSADVVGLNKWIGPFLPARDASKFDLQASFDMAGDQLNISKMNLIFGATSLAGNLHVTGVGSRVPQISGTIDADTLDFGAAAAEQAVYVVEAPLTVSGMPSGKIDLSWKRALWGKYYFGKGSAVVERPPGTQRIQLTLAETEVYGGAMRGAMALDVSEGMRALNVEGRIVGAQIGQLLSSGMPNTRPAISGRSTLEIGLFSVGGTPHELLQALTGKVEFIALEGKLGVSELVQGLAPEAGDILPFNTLNGTFKIGQGVAAVEDLILLDGKLSLVGTGKIDLANWTIDLNVGRLSSDGNGRTLKKYRVSGPAADMKVELVKGP